LDGRRIRGVLSGHHPSSISHQASAAPPPHGFGGRGITKGDHQLSRAARILNPTLVAVPHPRSATNGCCSGAQAPAFPTILPPNTAFASLEGLFGSVSRPVLRPFSWLPATHPSYQRPFSRPDHRPHPDAPRPRSLLSDGVSQPSFQARKSSPPPGGGCVPRNNPPSSPGG